MMKLLFVFASITVSIIWAHPSGKLLENHWHNFKVTHSKKYANVEEEHLRMKIFKENFEKIEQHNEMYEKGMKTYTMGVNQFGDMTGDEFMIYVNKYAANDFNIYNSMTKMNITTSGQQIPASFDWRNNGVVTEVKNQKFCGSAWAFSATGALEGMHALKTGKLQCFSEQDLVDCAREKPNDGCSGGNPYIAFLHVAEFGINTEEDYPYEGSDAQCRHDSTKTNFKVSDAVMLEPKSEDEFAAILSEKGPISVMIHVKATLQFYKDGIYEDGNCNSDDGKDLNHAVLAVGYGNSSDKQYWLLKNSFGPEWGAEGYMTLPRNQNNYCGIISRPSLPIPE